MAELVDAAVFKTEVLAGRASSNLVGDTIVSEDWRMSKQEEKMKPLVDRIADIDRQIEELGRRLGELNAVKRNLADVLAQIRGEVPPKDEWAQKPRNANVKGVVLDIMVAAGPEGRTSAEVVMLAQQKLPGVVRDTISSILSRLKAAGALAHDGLRYYEARHAPRPGEVRQPHVRAV